MCGRDATTSRVDTPRRPAMARSSATATRASVAPRRTTATPRGGATARRARRVGARASTKAPDGDADDADADDANDAASDAARAATREPRRRAESTDAVATFMTRRFGLKGGLAWLGVLTFGVLSEQLKTRRETREAIENTKDVRAEDLRTVELPSGVTYVEYTRGGGERVRKQYLCAAKLRARAVSAASDAYDTESAGREIVWSFGGKLGPPLCRGLEEGVAGMRQGGRRVVRVPARLAFGSEGADFPRGGKIDPDVDVEFDVTLTRVSVPPS